MITSDQQKSLLPFGQKLLMSQTYIETTSSGLSEVARAILHELHPGRQATQWSTASPEVVALRLLDYLSSKKSYIRRKSLSFRTKEVYQQIMPQFVPAIIAGRPITMNAICLCTNLCSTELVGESPYPHMASYLGLENLHKILQGARHIYEPGITITLGFEGNLFKPMFFHNDKVITATLATLQELNDTAYTVVTSETSTNPITILDAEWMIAQAFGSTTIFSRLVTERATTISADATPGWQDWYDQSTANHYFTSRRHKAELTQQLAKWRNAVCSFKYAGGRLNGGFMRYSEDIIPFTMSGRRQNLVALQFVPENPYMPHHRAMSYCPATNKWRMKSYKELQEDSASYAPRLIGDYDHPFYYEKQNA